MYADGGVMPIREVQNHFAGSWRWSLHWLSGAPAFQMALFGLAGLLAVLLLIGCLTRVATIGSWILLASLITRAPLVINAGDTLLLLLLFWSMFLPLGRMWSVDALVQRRPRDDRPIGS